MLVTKAVFSKRKRSKQSNKILSKNLEFLEMEKIPGLTPKTDVDVKLARRGIDLGVYILFWLVLEKNQNTHNF